MAGMRLLLVHSFLLAVSIVRAAVTAYGPHVQQPLGTLTAASASYTGAATYDDVILNPPPVPNPPPPTSFAVQLETGSVSGLSIPQSGSFFGFSIELSVVTQVRKCQISCLLLASCNHCCATVGLNRFGVHSSCTHSRLRV
jgi:hypothetical protein